MKEDFNLRGFPTFGTAETAVEQAISAYNSVRPHASLGYKTPIIRLTKGKAINP
ncbi:integrase core domain-containing protein [Spirosoma flavum]|uniref:Integrase core domain-containing protein n=1 Tax=Spirosoma flavum TaxID=2048557 RepID=A0ABW6AK20_9BACT